MWGRISAGWWMAAVVVLAVVGGSAIGAAKHNTLRWRLLKRLPIPAAEPLAAPEPPPERAATAAAPPPEHEPEPAPQPPPAPARPRMLLCRDGTTSPTCVCGGPRRGCCSRHGGVAGCE